MKADKADVHAIEVRVAELEVRFKATERQVDAAPNVITTMDTIPTLVREEIEERRQIDLRKTNLIVSNMADNSTDTSDCKELFKQVCPNEDEVDIETTVRLGRRQPDRIQPLKIVLRSQQQKKQILQRATTLRDENTARKYKDVYIRPDLTTKQQRESKNLRDEIREKRAQEPNKRYRIQRGKVIEVVPGEVVDRR